MLSRITTYTHMHQAVIIVGILPVAFVTNNKRLLNVCSVLLKLTTDIHEASRGLFVTAELLVGLVLSR